MHIYEVIRCFIKMDFERLSSFITNCHKVVYNKKKFKNPKSFQSLREWVDLNIFANYHLLLKLFSQGFGEGEKGNYWTLLVYVFSAVYYVYCITLLIQARGEAAWGVQRDQGCCCETFHNSNCKFSPCPHTEASQQSSPAFPPSTWSIPDCARLGGTAQGYRKQPQPPRLAALLVFSSKFCKCGA